MKKRLMVYILTISFIFTFITGSTTGATSQEKILRVGMEAAYSPFNWTQNNSENGAVPIEGSTTFANGYDVQIAKKIAEYLGMKLMIVKTEWDGLLPSVQSGKIDAIIAGMSPTTERKKELDFTQSYYNSQLVLVTKSNGKYANAKNFKDLEGAKIVAQLNTFHDGVIDQIPNITHSTPMTDFSAMRVAVESEKVDAYIAEKPEGISAEKANKAFKMIDLKDAFNVSPEETSIAIGLKKDSPLLEKMNEALSKITIEEQNKIMNEMINLDLGITQDESIWDIALKNKDMFISGTLYTLLISLVGTIIGLFVGMFVGIIRTTPKLQNTVLDIFIVILKFLSNIYVQIIRGTPMMVQAVLFYYGLQLFYGVSFSPLQSAFIVVSINTGAYMAEVVRAGINSIHKGQVEAAKAIGLNHFQIMTSVILPQVFKNILPNIGNEFIVNIKDTSVLNVISVQELFFNTKSVAGANFKFFQTYFITSLIYLVLTLSISGLLRILEKKLEGSGSYVKAKTDNLASGN